MGQRSYDHQKPRSASENLNAMDENSVELGSQEIGTTSLKRYIVPADSIIEIVSPYSASESASEV